MTQKQQPKSGKRVIVAESVRVSLQVKKAIAQNLQTGSIIRSSKKSK